MLLPGFFVAGFLRVAGIGLITRDYL